MRDYPGQLICRTYFSGPAAFQVQPQTRKVRAILIGSGGGGGGVASNAAGFGACAGGGAPGGYLEVTFPISTPQTTLGLSFGAAGTAGASGGGNGGLGGNVVLTANGITYTAFGGGGGGFTATGAVVAFALGGAPAAVSTNGDVNSSGGHGLPGFLDAAGASGIGGAGGSNVYGKGGDARNTSGAGNAGKTAIANNTAGSGGGGALSLSGAGAAAGSAGRSGFMMIEEFA